jgi:hypothetical protein
VKSTIGPSTVLYLGNYFEWTGSTNSMKKYYYAKGQRAAMRLGSSTLRFLMGAHLGTTSLMVNITSYANYTVTTPLTGRDQIDIVFTNDYYQSLKIATCTWIMSPWSPSHCRWKGGCMTRGRGSMPSMGLV